nr:IQ motif, EF-hand binding site, P-loop containing nucleoside triphosphate hydrolase [Tanacetum cinerariifolium]
MATLSTLELMLHEIQNKEKLEPYGDHGRTPTLPQRPVSKARMPSRRARRAVLSFHLQEISAKKKEEFVNGVSKRDKSAFVKSGLVLSKNDMNNDGNGKTEKGILRIQKCVRGYQARFHYHKLKEGIITLQSFVRGENARREFQNAIRRVEQAHINQEFVWGPLRDRETTIIYLQSVVRSWLSRRQIGYAENTTIKNTKEANDQHNENTESQEHVTVSESYIRDLEEQVLRTETAILNKKHENSILELQIKEIDKKWELHKAKMNMMEKTWQDEFAAIQENLALSREKVITEITVLPQNDSRPQENGKTILNIREILNLQESDSGFCLKNTLDSSKGHKQELKKLKVRFKAWQKEFKSRLHDIKKTLDRYDDDRRTERAHKICFLS